ncbi:DUF1003 domain-containing protein [Mesorhizobium sp. AR07]|uniref:DUF1003 domain-containing protein n=1 Tax=Mesorhizobium sp. AR07 TaxID=2865838 RepID=UPI0021604102|nr:DUF1003 domain-containing protein [Mesorhizobium sp. AR07]UVK45303.1 DUF1003 domain-containing protein [Mesorhizobium sp. AR07]
MTDETNPAQDTHKGGHKGDRHFFRFHLPHVHLHSPYGDDWFALKAEKFARFFGTPTFLIAQSVIVGAWILVNIVGVTQFDVYPFILLNLAFSLQAAYAAPLILLAQTRQADRDKAHAEADALHREDLARASEERLSLAAHQTTMLVDLVKQNTKLTETIKALTERVEILTIEVHKQVIASATTPPAGGIEIAHNG